MSVGGVFRASEGGETRSSRGQDRLANLRQVVEALGAALSASEGQGHLETIFERQVRQMLNLRSVRLREVRTRYQARLVTPTRTSESIVLGVPTTDPNVQAVLEASHDAGASLNESDVDMLAAMAQLG